MLLKTDKKTLRAQARFAPKRPLRAAIDEQNRSFDRAAENFDLLMKCRNDWNRLDGFRRERARNLRYKNGDQWGDPTIDPDTGRSLREDELLSSKGRVPLKHNFIQQFVRSIEGQMLSNPSTSIVYARAKDDAALSDMLTNTLQACHHLNRTTRLDTTVLEELLLAGLACVKTRYTFWSTQNRADGRLDVVGANRLFFNTDIEDPRLFDLRRIGEIHDYTPEELVGQFAASPQDAQALQEIYAGCYDRAEAYAGRDVTREKQIGTFLRPDDPSKCRVFEVWQRRGRWVTYVHDYADGTEQITELSLRQVEAINAERLSQGEALGMPPESIALIYAERKYEYYWEVRFLTPNGVCIRSMETPYTHEEHPYSLALLPATDGAIRGVMNDLIDIQRYINRLIVMIDFIMNTSAKGVLLVPEDCVPEGMSEEEFAAQWVKANGVVFFTPRPDGRMPTQVSANSTNIGAWDMLQLEMNLLQQIAGISGAMQGHAPRPNTPSSLYAQEAQNSTLNYLVVFDAFKAFKQERDEKLLKVLMQYYTDRRHVDISGRAYSETARFYDPRMAEKIVDFNLVVTQSTDTPVFRAAMDDMLLQLFQTGAIPLEMFLDNTSMPFAEKLKSDLKQLREQAQQGQMDPSLAAQVAEQAAAGGDGVPGMEGSPVPGGIDPALAAQMTGQVSSGAPNPQAQALAQQFLG
ncbi:hypothetical protein [uncultured Rikenella sp.]|uniref:portal protein n=1 Tax=uncultured Rikenella sp. TaxID=368003 RepID=UPI00260EA88D|nr:hypothetical protein [uncultured Rikenella sp.]